MVLVVLPFTLQTKDPFLVLYKYDLENERLSEDEFDDEDNRGTLGSWWVPFHWKMPGHNRGELVIIDIKIFTFNIKI